MSYRSERVAAALTFVPRAVSRRIGLQQLILAYGFTDESAIVVRLSIEHAIGAAVLDMEMAAEMLGIGKPSRQQRRGEDGLSRLEAA